MKKRMLVMVAAVVLFLAVIGFVKFQQIRTAMAAGQSFKPPPEAVTTVVAAKEEWPNTVEAVGSVAAAQGVTLSADLAGVVDKILFKSGSHVEDGQILVTLDTRQERASLASAQAQRDLAKTNLERATKLRDQHLIADADYDQTETLYKQADAAVAAIQATIDRKTIRAPFAGVTGIREVNLGQYVQSGDPIVPLQSERPIFVNFYVPQDVVSSLRVGATVNAAPDSSASAKGRITAINPVIDVATRNVSVQATFRNEHGVLHPGAYANVQVNLGSSAPVIGLPTSAINYAPYGNSVFILDKMKGPNGAEYTGVRQQFVRLGKSKGDRVAVLTGVAPGDTVVTSGVFKLRPGAAVQVNNEIQPSNSLTPKTQDS